VDLLGLSFDVAVEDTVDMPAYEGPLGASYAQVDS
jgi:hypothetical protein